jgi:hypothetical protein
VHAVEVNLRGGAVGVLARRVDCTAQPDDVQHAPAVGENLPVLSACARVKDQSIGHFSGGVQPFDGQPCAVLAWVAARRQHDAHGGARLERQLGRWQCARRRAVR